MPSPQGFGDHTGIHAMETQGFPAAQEISHTTFRRKIMAKIFRDMEGVLLIDYLPQGDNPREILRWGFKKFEDSNTGEATREVQLRGSASA